MSSQTRVHVEPEYCECAGRWRPMISVWHTQDGVYVKDSYQFLLPDDFAAHIQKLQAEGQTGPPEYETALQRARSRQHS